MFICKTRQNINYYFLCFYVEHAKIYYLNLLKHYILHLILKFNHCQLEIIAMHNFISFIEDEVIFPLQSNNWYISIVI